MKSQTIDGMHYLDSGGSKPALVLLHGFPMSSAVWTEFADIMSDDFRVIVPDFRGFGRSQPRIPKPSLSIMAGDVNNLLDRLEIAESHVAGVSLGGMAALTLALEAPSRVKSLALFHSEAQPDDPDAKARRDLQIASVQLDGVSPFAANFAERVLPEGTATQLVERLRAVMEATTASTVIEGLELLRDRPDLRPRLPDLSCPTLVVAGALDLNSDERELREMARAVRHGSFALLPDAGHLSVYEMPAAAAETLRVWLSGLP